MKIDQIKKVVVNEVQVDRYEIIPSKNGDLITEEFIQHYKGGKSGKIGRVPYDSEVIVSIALCILEDQENWQNVVTKLKEERWEGASLIMWNLYTRYQKIDSSQTIVIPGTRYRDENFFEWVPFVNYSIKGTRVLMKPYSSLPYTKSRIVLISKMEIKKM